MLCEKPETVGDVVRLLSKNIDVILVVRAKSGFSDLAGLEGFTVIESKSTNFSYLRNLGVFFAKTDYVLFLDSDEEIDHQLLNSLSNTIFTKDAYWIQVIATFGERQVRMWSFKKVKIVKRTKAHFTGRVHEQIALDGASMGVLTGTIVNHTFRNWLEYYEKRRKYVHLEPKSLRRLVYRFLTPWFLYFTNGGAKDGLLGIQILMASLNYALMIATHGRAAASGMDIESINRLLSASELNGDEKEYISHVLSIMRQDKTFNRAKILEETEQLFSPFIGSSA